MYAHMYEYSQQTFGYILILLFIYLFFDLYAALKNIEQRAEVGYGTCDWPNHIPADRYLLWNHRK